MNVNEVIKQPFTQNTQVDQLSKDSNSSKVAKEVPTQEKGIDETKDKNDADRLKQELNNIVEKLNKEINTISTKVQFGFIEEQGSLYVSVLEKDSGKMIRKMPTDEAIKLSTKMKEVIGMIFDKSI